MLNAACRHRLRTTFIALLGIGATIAASLAVPAMIAPASATVTPTCDAAGITVTGLGGPNFYIDSGSSPSFRSAYTGYRVTNGSGATLDDVWVKLSDFTGGSLDLATGQSAAQRVGDLGNGAAGSRFWYLTAASTTASAQNHVITVYSHNPTLSTATALCTTTGGFSSVQGTLDAAANKVTGITVSGGTPKLGSEFTITVTGNTGQLGQGITGDSYSMWMSPAVTQSWPADAFRLVGTSLTISPDGSAPDVTYTDILRKAGLGSTARDYTATYTFRAVGFTATSTTVKPVQEISSGTQVKHTGSYSVALPAIPAPTNDLSFALTSTPDKLDLGGGDVVVTGSTSGTAGAELDSLLLTVPACASVKAGTASWNGQPIADPVSSGADLVFSGPFVVGGAGLEVGLHLDGTPGTCRAQLLGVLGSARIGRTASPIDGTNPATVDIEVDGAPAVTDKTVATVPGAPVTINLAPLVTDPNADAWTVATTGAPQHGTVTVDGYLLTYTPSDSEYVGQDSFTVTVDDHRGGTGTGTVTVDLDPNAQPALLDQSLDFTQPDDLVVGESGDLQVVADSGLPVTLTSQTPSVCSVVGNEVSALAAGTCSLEATQDGDAQFAPAEPVTRTLTVGKRSQTITFTPPATVLGVDPVTLDGEASSDLPVAYSVTSGDCTVDATALTATGAGTCVVEAAQSGDATHAAAEPVAGEITFVVPADDTATTPGRTAVDIDVTDNDPAGVVLTAAGTPAHGTTSLVDGKVRYAPESDFRGTDHFSYTVSRAGRTAQAQVEVTVGNLGPAIAGATLTQTAGTSASTLLAASDPNGDPLTLGATSADPSVSAQVVGPMLTLSASPAASGLVHVSVTATDSEGASATATVTSLVTPVAPADARRRLSTAGTDVSWTAAPTTGARYEVLVDGKLVCTTAATSCHLATLTGPAKKVAVRTLGRDDTRSGLRPAPLSGHGAVLITTVYFDSGSARLTRADRRILRSATRVILTGGFARTRLDGYTDADGGLAFNMALSHRRTDAVAAYLHGHGKIASVGTWHGELDPVASNTVAHGKARNRRVEVFVRY